MKKRSASIIVCNGQPFIKPQLENIYDHVDEIIIVEGADKWFQKVIKSKRSNDGTIELIKAFPDPDDKIKLIHVNHNKNLMVKVANENCTGDYIYHVDVDEFMRPEHIEQAFGLLDKSSTVHIPQRWFYKWTDIYLSSARVGGIRVFPARFFRNRIKEGLIISHIPCSGYYKGKKHIKADFITLPVQNYAYHYLAIFREQLERKMKYYSLRDGIGGNIVKQRLAEFDKALKKPGTAIKSYHGSLVKEENPYINSFGEI